MGSMRISFRSVWAGGLAGLLGLAAARAEPVSIRYTVEFKGMVVATQTVTLANAEGGRTVSAEFAADLPVFVTRQPYSERQSVAVRADGTIERFDAERQDGPLRTVVEGRRETNGLLRIVRTDPAGTATNFIARADYDFHSLVIYGTAPAEFLPTNNPARVLQIPEGRVATVNIQAIEESETTPERQHVRSTHLAWTQGPFLSHTWHPEKYGNLPRRYVRQTENGEFRFTLVR